LVMRLIAMSVELKQIIESYVQNAMKKLRKRGRIGEDIKKSKSQAQTH
jgi:hypothetical protein